MSAWRPILREAIVAGTIASLLSTAVLAVCGRIERRDAVGPTNAPSQWLWGEGAAYETRATLRHTLVGYVIHHLMSIFWALVHQGAFGGRAATRTLPHALATGAISAGLANFVDYRLTPRRLRPGFEKHLSRWSLFAAYAAFGLGLALPALMHAGRPPGRLSRRAPRALPRAPARR